MNSRNILGKWATTEWGSVAPNHPISIQWPFDKLVLWVVTWPLTCDCRNWEQQSVSRATKIAVDLSATAVLKLRPSLTSGPHTQ